MGEDVKVGAITYLDLDSSSTYTKFIRQLSIIIFGREALINGCLNEKKISTHLEGKEPRKNLDDALLKKIISKLLILKYF